MCCWTCSHTLDELKLKDMDGKRTDQPATVLDDTEEGQEQEQKAKAEPGM